MVLNVRGSSNWLWSTWDILFPLGHFLVYILLSAPIYLSLSLSLPLSLSLHELFTQGVGGSVQYPIGYLKKAYEIARESGGLCISDEVGVYGFN